MSKEGTVYLFIILNAISYANVILQRSSSPTEGHFGVDESIYIDPNETNLDTNYWIYSVNE